MTTTKEQERKALEKIKALVEQLGPDSYLATAFEGCFEIAAENMLKLMDEKGDSDTAFLGSNENMEDTTTSISHDKIVHVTFQSNGWVRKNIYHRDGTCEEIFDGKWNK